MGNDESRYKKQLEVVQSTLKNYINIKKGDKSLVREKSSVKIKEPFVTSRLNSGLNSQACLHLMMEVLASTQINEISESSNCCLAKSIFNSNIYVDSTKKSKEVNEKDTYYGEQIRLIEDLESGQLLKIVEISEPIQPVMQKPNNSMKNPEEIVHNELSLSSNKDVPKKLEKDVNSIKQKNEEFLKKVSSKRGDIKRGNKETTNESRSPRSKRTDVDLDDLSIEAFLKKETNRIKSIYGNGFLNESKATTETNQPDDSMVFDMRRNKHLQNTKGDPKSQAKTPNKMENSIRKNLDLSQEKSKISNNKSVLNNSKQINIKIDLSKFISPETANKSFTTKNKSLSPGVRINYVENKQARNITNTSQYTDNSREISYTSQSRERVQYQSTKKNDNYYSNLRQGENGKKVAYGKAYKKF